MYLSEWSAFGSEPAAFQGPCQAPHQNYASAQLCISREVTCLAIVILDKMSAKPQFLSGDRTAIDEFLSKFDVSPASHPAMGVLTSY